MNRIDRRITIVNCWHSPRHETGDFDINYCSDLGYYLGSGVCCHDRTCQYAADCEVLRASEKGEILNLAIQK